jgi:integrase/recombinase XerD
MILQPDLNERLGNKTYRDASSLAVGQSDRGAGVMLAALINRYVAQRVAGGHLTPKAARGIRYKLNDFEQAVNAQPANITRRHVERWMERPEYAAGYQRQRLSALRGFCQWCVVNGHMRRDPTLGVIPPKIPKAAPRRLNTSHARAVAAQAPDNRGKAVVLLMLQEGLRCIEVTRAELGDLDLITRSLGVRGKGGAGGVTRTVPLSEETCRVLERYLTEHPAAAGPLIRSYHHPNRGVTSAHLGAMVTEWMYEAGVKQRARDGKSPHSLRHTCASDMAEQGRRLEHIQHALGHANPATTQIYTSGVTPDLREAMAGRSYLG